MHLMTSTPSTPAARCCHQCARGSLVKRTGCPSSRPVQTSGDAGLPGSLSSTRKARSGAEARTMGTLYAANTAGAVVGVLLLAAERALREQVRARPRGEARGVAEHRALAQVRIAEVDQRPERVGDRRRRQGRVARGLQAEAQQLAGQLDEAEAIVSRVVPPATCAVQTARLYVLRARRLAAAGDREGARQARDLAQGWTALYTGLGGATRRAETSETQAAAR